MRSQGDGFADDDPLAELARIVGFDQPLKREPVVTLPQAPDMGSADFNLEDELMREFEGYEAAPSLSSCRMWRNSAFTASKNFWPSAFTRILMRALYMLSRRPKRL